MGSDDDLRRLIQSLARGALEGQVRNLRDYNSLRQLVEAGSLDQTEVNDAYREYAREVNGEYGRRITDLSARYYADLLALGNDYSGEFLKRVTQGLRSSPDGPRGPIQPIPLEVYGSIGGRADGRFELINEQPATCSVSFLVSPLHGPRGELFRPIVMIEPMEFELTPGAVQEVRLTVVLEPEMFSVGTVYTGTVEVIGFPEVALALTVWAADRTAAAPYRAESPGAEPMPPRPAPPDADRIDPLAASAAAASGSGAIIGTESGPAAN